MFTPILDTNSTKSAIVTILGQGAPLSLKQLNAEIQKQTNKQITYQATHKTVKKLLEEKVLQKTSEKKYTINKGWIYNTEVLLKTMKDNIDSKNEYEKVSIYTFDTYGKFASAIIQLVHDAPNPDKKIGACLAKHSWPTIGLSKTDYELLLELLTTAQYYDVITSKTPLDEDFGKTLAQMGKTVKVGSKITAKYDKFCAGDDLFEVDFGNEVDKELDRIFKKHQKLDDSTINDLLKNLIAKKSEIRIIHTKSKNKSDLFRRQILKEFNTQPPN